MNRVVNVVALVSCIYFACIGLVHSQDVKYSKNGICHTEQSPFYTRVKHYTPFPSLTACLSAGGRLPAKYKAAASTAKYARRDWPHWTDDDQDCQNTRAEILIRDAAIPVQFKSSQHCKVISGSWHDPYTNQILMDASDLDIDHVVPLAHAFEHGGANWTKAKRQQFANDPLNLLAVDDSANQQKRAQAPHQWMPSNAKFHCRYIAIWQQVKQKYQLGASEQENLFIQSQSKRCDDPTQAIAD